MIIRKLFKFEGAHIVRKCTSDRCRENIHGHSYIVEVFITSDKLDNGGMVMDFGDLKRIVNRLVVEPYDHALVLRQTPENLRLLEQVREKWERVYLVDYQPTCEQMLIRFAGQIAAELPRGVQLAELRLYETEKSHATWRAEDNSR